SACTAFLRSSLSLHTLRWRRLFDGRRLFLLPTLGRNLLERAPVAIQHGPLTDVLLPAPDDHVAIRRVNFHQPGAAPQLLRREPGAPRSSEKIQDLLAGLG